MVIYCACGFSCGTDVAYGKHKAKVAAAADAPERHQKYTEEEHMRIKDQILLAFLRFDLDGNGRITQNELASVLRSVSPEWTQQRITTLFHAINQDSNNWISYNEFVEWAWRSADSYAILQQMQSDHWCRPSPAEQLPRSRPEPLDMEVIHCLCKIVRHGTVDDRLEAQLGVSGNGWELQRVTMPPAYDKFPGDKSYRIPFGRDAFEFFYLIFIEQGGVKRYLTRAGEPSLEPLADPSKQHLQWWALVAVDGSTSFQLRSMSHAHTERMMTGAGSFALTTDVAWTITDHEDQPFKYSMGEFMKALMQLLQDRE